MAVVLWHQELCGVITDEVNDVDEKKTAPRAPVPPEGGDWPPRPPVQPLNTEFTIPLKYYNDFQRSLDFLLVNG